MKTINDNVKLRHLESLRALVAYLLKNSGIQPEELPALIENYLQTKIATKEEIANSAPNRLLDIQGGEEVVRLGIAKWIQAAPDALNSLEELATALQNDPDIIGKIFDQLGKKASIEDLNKRQLTSNVDFHDQSWDSFFNFSVAGLSSKPSGIYHGVASVERLKLKEDYSELNDFDVCNVTVSIVNLQTMSFAATAMNLNAGTLTLPVIHQNVMPSFYVNGNRANLEPNTDLTNPNSITVTGTSIVEGDIIELRFNTYKSISQYLKSTINITAAIHGATFNRVATIDNNVLVQNDKVTTNVWTSALYDVIDLSMAITDAFNEVLNEAQPPQ